MTGEMVEKLVCVFLCAVSFFAGWQWCLMNVRRKQSTTYHDNQARRQWKAAQNLANRFENALDCSKKGDIPGVYVTTISFNDRWRVLVYKDNFGDARKAGFTIDIPLTRGGDLHVTSGLAELRAAQSDFSNRELFAHQVVES